MFYDAEREARTAALDTAEAAEYLDIVVTKGYVLVRQWLAARSKVEEEVEEEVNKEVNKEIARQPEIAETRIEDTYVDDIMVNAFLDD